MTNARWKVRITAMTACLIVAGGFSASGDDRESLGRLQKSIQDEQKRTTRHIAALEKEIQALRADVRSLLTELQALRAAQGPPAVAEAMPPVPPQTDAGEPTPAVAQAMPPRLPPGIVADELPTFPDVAKKPSTEPAVFRLTIYNDHSGGDLLMVVSPEGDRLVLTNPKTGDSRPLKLSGDKDHPHQVSLADRSGISLVALAIKGPKVSRLAVLSFEATRSGSTYAWYPIDLREPVDSAYPVVHEYTTATYTLDHRVYAFSQPARRWDVLELPRGADATRTGFSSDGPTVEHDGHVYTFVEATGRWKDIDVRAILDPSPTKAKK